MTQEKDYIDLADEMASDIRFIRTLLGAAMDKTSFYRGNPALLGPYREILSCQAQEIEELLARPPCSHWFTDSPLPSAAPAPGPPAPACFAPSARGGSSG